jgi:hypothetical protein
MRWQYLTLDMDWRKDPTALLNDYGSGGRELVAALPTVAAVGSAWESRYLMKRRVEESGRTNQETRTE